MNYEKILRWVSGAFLVLLAFLTFFSRTLADLRLPRASLAFVQSGTISERAVSFGVIAPRDVVHVFAPASGRITQILSVGEQTTATTVLFEISSDVSALGDMLTRAEDARFSAQLTIERMDGEIAFERTRLNNLISERNSIQAGEAVGVFDIDAQIVRSQSEHAIQADNLHTNTQAQINSLQTSLLAARESANIAIDAAREEYEASAALYEMGVLSRQQRDGAADALTLQISRLEQLETDTLRQIEDLQSAHERTYEQMLQRHTQEMDLLGERRNMSIEQSLDAVLSQIDAQRLRLQSMEFSYSIARLEIERADERIEEIDMLIENDGTFLVRMPPGSSPIHYVHEIMPGIGIGSLVSEGMPVLAVYVANHQLEVDAMFSQAHDFIQFNTLVRVVAGTRSFNARVRTVRPQGGNNLTNITISSNLFSVGELVMLEIARPPVAAANVVPAGALREDNIGYYILAVHHEPGFLGGTYTLWQVRVQPGMRDASGVVIAPLPGAELPEGPVVVTTDVPVTAGTRIRPVSWRELVRQ